MVPGYSRESCICVFSAAFSLADRLAPSERRWLPGLRMRVSPLAVRPGFAEALERFSAEPPESPREQERLKKGAAAECTFYKTQRHLRRSAVNWPGRRAPWPFFAPRLAAPVLAPRGAFAFFPILLPCSFSTF